MAERRALSDVEVAHLLEDLGGHLETPAGDVIAAVRTRLDGEPAHRRARTGPGPWPTRPARLAFAGLVVVVILTAALVISPTARHAVADWLGLRGVLIEQQNSPPRTRLGGRLSLGQPVSLTQARSRVSFAVLVPAASRFGTPAEAYTASTPSGGAVTLLYRARPGLPAASPSGVGLLVTEFRAQIQEAVIRKVIGPGVRFEQLTVAGEPGYWFEGQPHEVFFADRHGRFFRDRSRLAGNTLLWQHGPLTLRLESALPKDRATQVAESLTTRKTASGTTRSRGHGLGTLFHRTTAQHVSIDLEGGIIRVDLLCAHPTSARNTCPTSAPGTQAVVSFGGHRDVVPVLDQPVTPGEVIHFLNAGTLASSNISWSALRTAPEVTSVQVELQGRLSDEMRPVQGHAFFATPTPLGRVIARDHGWKIIATCTFPIPGATCKSSPTAAS